ncbi:putative isomerase YbhE [Curvularia clavata]|uniref:Isomerase YbhE n=1 Tax=Curvularia clavata TaxID=95742 RepID=A0A9Q8Z0H8_CURCL|nr:putative isomerase YbhE [Curvularia clavata]
MKSDTYLDHCLTLAENSRLRNKHGAIIVHGGKVIGEGYNAWRAGFDGGGTVKTGHLSVRSSNGQSATASKSKLKHKLSDPEQSSKTFTPVGKMVDSFEDMPLSMHSEMMAVDSALSGSKSLAVSSRNPRFKTLGNPKQTLQLRQKVQSYVAAASSHPHAQKHHADEKNLSRHKLSNKSLSRTSMTGTGVNADDLSLTASQTKTTSNRSRALPSTTAPITTPKGQTQQSVRDVRNRTREPRLNGADLYVARLGWKSCCEDTEPEPEPEQKTESEPAPSSSSFPSPPPASQPRSLYDELTNPGGRTPIPADEENPPQKKERVPRALASRPCYQCILYMADAGIKRVFWTDAAGKWHKSMVRDLIDEMNKLGSEKPSDDAAPSDVYVTAKEVERIQWSKDRY